ncbi:exopolysaccharide biosynthesis polyprenyl glycosylphosphotransferase [Flavobacterium crassostreae]|uniref:Sugar transferase n=1 Tax=Flavobacterium crassostreae TaxID=1763534 RepID=A0A1B9E411_9FLAO|nr:exopolysaccharide biosynthesis polyprenyl glycosylphosphotransferase [Flavobacterium crassostreae]OCB76667.1 sugar transferase [Flavobacterium crassostreae]
MMTKKKIYFEISERKMLLRLIDVLVVLTSLYSVGVFFDLKYLTASVTTIPWVGMLIIYINVFGAIFEMYNLQVASNEFQVLKSTLITVSTVVVVYLLTPILSPLLPNNRVQIVAFYLVILIALFIWRLFYVRFLASALFFQRAILICDNDQVEELVVGLENIDPHYKIVGYVSADTPEEIALKTHYVAHIQKEDLCSYVSQNAVSEIVIGARKTEVITNELYWQLLQLLKSGSLIREYTQVYESKTQRIPVQFVDKDFYRFFPFSRSNQNKLYLSIVRVLELVCSILGLVLMGMLIPLVLLGNLLGNRGKLFYTQERVGKDGKVFKIIKFRSMIKNAETGKAVFATSNDKRVNTFGKFLRKSRIDEFPQFINILKGDMAIIGPRPERPYFVAEIAKRMAFYETRHIIKPGLTGWAQVNYSYGESIEDSLVKLQYDLYYIKHRSFYLDLNITIKTITTIVLYRGQ